MTGREAPSGPLRGVNSWGHIAALVPRNEYVPLTTGCGFRGMA